MPSVQPPAKVLVTGANGFIGAWTVRAFLERGYDVRGTVRSKSKGEWIANETWAKAGPGKFEYAVVEDIEAARTSYFSCAVGAFDDALKGGVTVVAHTASPVMFTPELDPYALIDPAVKGTTGILNSIIEHAPSVRRVVITSSVATLVEPSEAPRLYTEENWNRFSVNDIETKGKASEPMHKYRASKVKAEEAAWQIVEQHKGKLNFEISTILPSFVFGPIIHEAPSIENLNETTKMFYQSIRNEVPPTDSSLTTYVDVRDVAQLHVKAVENDKAAGERFIASAGPYIWQDVYDALNGHSKPFTGVPVGTPGAGKNVKRRIVAYSNEKTKRVLGFEFRSLGDMAYDTLSSLTERGFWP